MAETVAERIAAARAALGESLTRVSRALASLARAGRARGLCVDAQFPRRAARGPRVLPSEETGVEFVWRLLRGADNTVMRYVLLCPDYLLEHLAAGTTFPGDAPVYLVSRRTLRGRLARAGASVAAGDPADSDAYRKAAKHHRGAVIAATHPSRLGTRGGGRARKPFRMAPCSW